MGRWWLRARASVGAVGSDRRAVNRASARGDRKAASLTALARQAYQNASCKIFSFLQSTFFKRFPTNEVGADAIGGVIQAAYGFVLLFVPLLSVFVPSSHVSLTSLR